MSKNECNDDNERDGAEHPPEDLLAAIQDAGGRAATVEIADRIGITRQGVFSRLQKLEKQGEVESQMVGANRMWMLAEDGKDGDEEE